MPTPGHITPFGHISSGPPQITAISPDTGYSNSDFITNAQNLTIIGSADPNDSLTLPLANGQVESTTSDVNGNWRYDCHFCQFAGKCQWNIFTCIKLPRGDYIPNLSTSLLGIEYS